MRRVELFELIRKDYEFGLSKREIARKRGVHRRTVRQALASAIPPARKRCQRSAPKLTPAIKAFVDQILESDKTAPRKQRHTARRIWQRCRDERGAEVAESTVRNYVRARRRELGLGISAFVPQHHEVGRAAEVDFYEADIDFPWGREKVSVIALRSEFSGAALHVAYPRNNQSALGIAACMQSRRVRFVTAAALVNELIEARDDHTLSRPRESVGYQASLS